MVKEGESEGYLDELLGINTKIYFSLFNLAEIRNYYTKNNFNVEFLESRNPYEFEIQNSRIYGIGKKV